MLILIDSTAMEKIKHYLKTLVPFDDRDWELFSRKLKRVVCGKGEAILKDGDVEKTLSFLETGMVRFYLPDPDCQRELTFSFAFENSFFSGYDSFLSQTPADYCIEALADCVMWQISLEDLHVIYNTTKVGNLIGRKVAESLYAAKMKRELALLKDSAKERYLDLLRNQPHFYKQIPLKYLASYIGVRPQSLSRIRRQIN
ncbi:MAG: Crp/Fnr family transcriptional regulator [Sphingobacteriaceae bacterium]